MDIACVYCKHHEFYFTEEPDEFFILCGIDDCFCSGGHDNEHDNCCAVFDEKCGECECAFFVRAEESE